MMATEKAQPVDIQTLSVEQLGNVIKQVDEDIQSLQNAYTALKIASNKFQDAGSALSEFKPENEGKEIFVPLTSSLYVKGRMVNVDKVLVDVGTGYFVEKSVSAAQEYTERRSTDINAKAEQIQKSIDAKRKSMIQIQMVYQAKLQLQLSNKPADK
uniref:Prefoldin subunit 5 n=1 Tax=Arcella intermedia TaxID=1963864 RepID=A0A6B2LN87_9EUKA